MAQASAARTSKPDNPRGARKWIREPLFHFLVLGALIFGANSWRDKGRAEVARPMQIEIGTPTITWLSEGYRRQWNRAPDAAELRALVNDHIREELLHREALALGLDRNDTIVRRRMAQKMEFLTQDIASAMPPDDAALRTFFAANSARYTKGQRLSFRHVYFSRDRRGVQLSSDAGQGLVALRTGASDETIGDPFLRQHEFANADAQEITAALGEEFATALAKMPAGEWLGPVESTYGLHLVRLVERSAPLPVAFESVRDTVARDLAEERRRLANVEFLVRLKARYQITVDEVAMAKAAQPELKTAAR